MFGETLGHLRQMIWCRMVRRTVTPFTGQRNASHLSFGQIEL